MNSEGSPFVFEPKAGSYSYQRTPTILWYKRGYVEIFWFAPEDYYLSIHLCFLMIIVLSILILREVILSQYDHDGSPDSPKQYVHWKRYFYIYLKKSFLAENSAFDWSNIYTRHSRYTGQMSLRFDCPVLFCKKFFMLFPGVELQVSVLPLLTILLSCSNRDSSKRDLNLRRLNDRW